MFNAVNGLGGGGQLDPKPSNDSNTALYSTFAVVGFFAGTITNKLGIRWTLSLGGLGYSVYISAYLCYNYTQNFGYIIFAGALLGVCAGMLWSAQGVIILSYPTEQEKGRFISWFWMIFNLGGVIGSLVSRPRIHSVMTALTASRFLLARTSTLLPLARSIMEHTSVSWYSPSSVACSHGA